MAYTIEIHGYAAKDPRIANAISFCDTLGGGEYDAVRHYIDCTGVITEWLADKMPRQELKPTRIQHGKTTRDAVRERLARMSGRLI